MQTATTTSEGVLSACRSRLAAVVDRADTQSVLMGVKLSAMVSEYVEHYWRGDSQSYLTEAVEEMLLSDVVNPESGRPSTIFDHVSKIDGRAKHVKTGQVFLIEHKTTSDTLEDDSPYWRRLSFDQQVSKYLLSHSQCGFDRLDGCVYDVVKKVSVKPKKLSSAQVKEIATDGYYCGFTVPDDAREAIRSEYLANSGPKGGFQGEIHESDHIELYGIRIRSIIREEPEKWFKRKVVVRTEKELLDYANELWQLTAEVRKARKSGASPRNSQACYAYGTPCEFFQICCGERSQFDQEFVQLDQVHRELECEFQNGGRDIITHSRLSTFMTCREKHRLRYEVGISRDSESDSEALQFGKLFHELMEIIWSSYQASEGSNNG